MKIIQGYIVFLFLIGSCSVFGQDKLLGDSEKPYLIKSIFFGGGSYYIDEEQEQAVFEFLNGVLLENYEIHIHSHTDNIGSRKFNEYLSQMRSGASYQMLEEGGYLMDNIFIKDHGFDNPEFDNATWEGRAQNRRVDIVLWPLPL
ncbi:OmpA family protein [Portibacter lacus]|uniref:OmpA-like domain-containing protein n=1 Tax=Portibacter lacus TaxID=1099794 RepID=A0AA37SS31_9BACT|nr:OmpA family protein [Portibacter lacus]GLR18549.1 hypothetical protein GCM10007940_31650 [Portibacter lacus]